LHTTRLFIFLDHAFQPLDVFQLFVQELVIDLLLGLQLPNRLSFNMDFIAFLLKLLLYFE